eukprot:Em0009g1072a
MEVTIFLLVAVLAAAHAAPTPVTDPTGSEIPCSILESHFAAEGRRLFTNGEGSPFVTCSRSCISPRGRVMRYYYCCSGYDPLVASSVSSSRTILDAVADHMVCVPSTQATAAAPTASSRLEMTECPSKNQPQTLNDFVYAIQVDLCRYGCIYQEIVDEQSGLIRNVTKMFYGCCPPHKAVAAGAMLRPTYTCATAEEMSDPSSSGTTAPPTQKPSEAKTDPPKPSEAPTTDAPKPSTAPRDAPEQSIAPTTDAPKPSTAPRDAPEQSIAPTTDAPKPSTAPRDAPDQSIAPTTDAPKPSAAPTGSSVPQTTNQFVPNSQTRLCTFTCTYEEADDLGFDTVTRLVTKNIYGCCSPYKAVAVGAVNRPVYECQ